MYRRSVLLILALFAVCSVVSSQSDACVSASLALAANQPCADAVTSIGELLSAGDNVTTMISMAQLDAYCTPDCRNLNNALLDSCIEGDNPLENVDITEFVCTTDGGVSCLDVTRSSEFTTMQETFQASVSAACSNETDEQTCSPNCTMAVQNYITASGCCLIASLEFADQFVQGGNILELVLSACPGVNPPESTCQVIGRDNGTDMPVTMSGNNGTMSGNNGTMSGSNGTMNGGTDSPNTSDNGAKGLVMSNSVLFIAIIIILIA